ncbi:hypothetical protein [Streptomyces sp. HUAS ZL42]|uniref:hypothetical protein n=1 Tax=Streptomyces sp. HUAS ZL42 TaxID=3231715 RepID=UPI00345EFBA5
MPCFSSLPLALHRTGAALVAAVTLAVTVGPLGGTASAYTADSGSLSFSGDPGEKVSGGEAMGFTTDTGSDFDVSGARDENSVFVQVIAPDGVRWALNMAAPSGQRLTSGTTYAGAQRWPNVQPGSPELEFSGTDRDCVSTGIGSFTIENISFGPYGSVRSLDATFEQSCDNSGLYLRGSIHAVMPEPPVALAVGVTADAAGTVPPQGGQPTVSGTVTCTKAARVALDGRVTQVQKRATVGNWFTAVVACTPGSPVPWTATPQASADAVPFAPGPADLTVAAKADDTDYGVTVQTTTATTVTLTRS